MKKKNNVTTSVVSIEQLILEIRGQKVMLDADLAKLYGVTTKRLNEQVKRNKERFPEDFMFKLNKEEVLEVVANCDHLTKLKFSHQLPYAFTEHGALMLASVLNSPIAIKASVEIVRAFVKIRTLLLSQGDLGLRMKIIETKITEHDDNFKVVFETIRNLILAAESRPVGFHIR